MLGSGSSAGVSCSGTASSEIAAGSQVCMKNAPVYQAGAVGFTVAGGVPKVGQLLGAAWNVTDTCRFKIIQPPKRPKLPELPREKDKAKEEYDSASMPPPPSPASSTCSDGSISSPAVGRRQKRSAPKDCPEKVDEEEWHLRDVIFVEDSKSVPTGRVLKADGPYVAVRFTQTSGGGGGGSSSTSASAKDGKEKEDESNLLNDNIRLLRKDELQVVKSGVLPRMPDCFQRTPKKVPLQLSGGDSSAEVLAISIDGQGIHAVVRNAANNKMAYKVFNLSSGKVETDSKFPTETQAFLGSSSANVRFQGTGESEFVSLLIDGNRSIYPMVKDSTPSADSIKDPHWLDLLPIEALGLGTHALPHVGSGKKNEVAVVVLSFVPQLLLAKILQCDVEGVRRTVASLESDPTSDATIETVQRILEERCDGGRNVFHAAVSMCQPTSNKDPDTDNTGSQGQTDHMSSIASAFSSRALMRDMMRRAAAASR